jgi:hypothetical protein
MDWRAGRTAPWLEATNGHRRAASADAGGETEMARQNALNVVLVHGGFVDGSGWEDVYKLLRHEG